MLYTSRAIVLRTVRYGETSLIADLYTEQKGLQTFIINSVRKAKASTPASFLQLMTLLEVVAYYQEQRSIHRLKEVKLDQPYATIPFDHHKSAILLCLAEICSKCIRTADPHPELFLFLRERLLEFDTTTDRTGLFMIRFLADLAGYLGFGIDLEDEAGPGDCFDLMEGTLTAVRPAHAYVLEGGDHALLRSVVYEDPALPYPDRRRLVDQLVIYYQLHVESLREVHSIRILRELLSA